MPHFLLIEPAGRDDIEVIGGIFSTLTAARTFAANDTQRGAWSIGRSAWRYAEIQEWDDQVLTATHSVEQPTIVIHEQGHQPQPPDFPRRHDGSSFFRRRA